MAIRRYCEDRDFVFNHHVVENITPDSYLVLERVAREASQYQAIAMCSIGLLPKEKSHRNEIMAACIRAGTSLHFVFEQIVINDLKQVQELSEFLNLMVVSGKQLDLITDLKHLLSREI